MASDHEVRAFAIISLHYLYIVCVALQEEDVRTSTVPPRITTTDPFTFRRYQSEQGKKTIVLGRGEIDFYSSDDSPYIGNDTNSTQEESPADVAAAAAESSEYKNPPIDQLAGM
jgi:hypothetical protein